jgi:hypothetical protein
LEVFVKRFALFVVAYGLASPAVAQVTSAPLVPTSSMTGPVVGTGASTGATLADRATQYGLDFDVEADFGAKCDGVADDAPAINAAIAAAGTAANAFGNTSSFVVRLPTGRLCRAASTINAAGGYGFTLDLGGYQPGNPIHGGGIICDAGVNPCVALGAYAVNDTTNLRNGSVTRSGTPAAGTVGIAVYGYHDTISSVVSDNSAMCWSFQGDNPAGAGVHTEVYGGSAQRCSDAYVDFNSYPEVYWFGGRFGMNGGGDYAASAYVRTEGGLAGTAGGPNTIQFHGVQFNSGSVGPKHFWEFVNLSTGGIPSIDATDFRVMGGHVENLQSAADGGAVFYSDASWNALDRVSLSHLSVNTPMTPMFSLNPATAVYEWDIDGVLMYVSDLTLAPNGWGAFNINGGRITGTMHLTGCCGGAANIVNLQHGASFTLDGAWGAFQAFGETYSAGSFINNATGSVLVDNAGGGRNALTVAPQTGTASMLLMAPPSNGIDWIYFSNDGNPNHVSFALGTGIGYGKNTNFTIQDGINGYGNAFTIKTGGNSTLGEQSSNVASIKGTIASDNSAQPGASGTCAVGSQTGGEMAGGFKASAACSGGTVILTFAATQTGGYACDAHDETTPADALNETAHSTTSVTFTGSMAANDVVVWKCIGF